LLDVVLGGYVSGHYLRNIFTNLPYNDVAFVNELTIYHLSAQFKTDACYTDKHVPTGGVIFTAQNVGHFVDTRIII